MYAVTVKFEIKPGMKSEFMPLMIENAQTSLRTETGCHQFDICHSGNAVFLYEVYEDRSAFDLHLNTAHFLCFDDAVTDMILGKHVETYDGVVR